MLAWVKGHERGVRRVCKKVLKKWVIYYHFVEKEYIGFSCSLGLLGLLS